MRRQGSRGAFRRLCGELSCPERTEQVVSARFGFALLIKLVKAVQGTQG